MSKIAKIIAREILNSQGHPTIEAIVQLADDSIGIFSSPSGTSRGKYEAVEVRDGDPKRFQGLGVLQSLRKIHSTLAPRLIGQEAQNQATIDQIIITADGTPNKSNLGTNVTTALSVAIAIAQAASEKMPVYQYIAKLMGNNIHEFAIPTPMFNILNGGQHADGNLDFQEFMIVTPRANAYSLNLRIATEVYYSLKDTIRGHSAVALIGEEGGYAPTLYSNLDALKILEEAITKAGYKFGLDAFISLDIAASNFKQGSSYKIKDRPVALSPGDFLEFIIVLNEQYHILSLEDPFDDDEWDQWRSITEKLGQQTLIVGDNFIATNPTRLEKAISQKAANSLVIKPNQIGTLTETIKVVKAAQKANFKLVVSHRSGDTNDTFIADFAVGVDADYVKFGAPARGERVAKYNRLLEIEHELS